MDLLVSPISCDVCADPYEDRGLQLSVVSPRRLIPRVRSPQPRLLLPGKAQHEYTIPHWAFFLASRSPSSNILTLLAIQGRHATTGSEASKDPPSQHETRSASSSRFHMGPYVPYVPAASAPLAPTSPWHMPFGPESKGEWNSAVEFRGSAVTAKGNEAGSLSRQEASSSIGWPSQCPEDAESWLSPDYPSLLPDNITIASRTRREEAQN